MKMERYTNTLTENYNTSVKVESVFQWTHILDYEIKEDVYGLTGWIKWNTDRNEKEQLVSSIHLDQHPSFKRLFKRK